MSSRTLASVLFALGLTALPFAASDDQVAHIPGAKTRAAFDKGAPLVETATYKVHASRRNEPGAAEVHTRDTDIVYVLEGTATLVTGGTVVDGKTIAPDEIRGSRIEGGASRSLARGDVVIVPNGVPHWFKEVQPPLLYYVVKVTAGTARAEAGPALGGMSPAMADAAGAAPAATIDLATDAGVALVKGAWRYSDVRIVETAFRKPGVEGQPTGDPTTTYDYEPRAGDAAFDDRTWPVIAPTSLSARRGNGRLSFAWYRIAVTIPERIGGYDPTGSTVTFDTAIDDYAEVWVDGELPRALGQSGGSVVGGWNASNKLVVGRDVQPGQRIQLAVFGANGPLSNPPTNFIWMRHARLEFRPGQPGPLAVTPQEVNVDVLRKDPEMDRVVGPNPKLFKLAEGFAFTEGPVYVPARRALLFSDPNRNTIYEYSEASGGTLSVFRTPSGYSGADIGDYRQPGSNGLALDALGRLTINEHGNRRVVRLDEGGQVTVVADRFEGKRLNSPNDLVYRRDGTLFFTDPPFGLPKFGEDPRKELPFSGVYARGPKGLQLVTKELNGPNGLAFSPDERYLYVGNWDEKKKVVMRYERQADDRYAAGQVFVDMTGAPGEDAIDGIKVDADGRLYVSGPGGLWVIAADGRHLGTIVTPRHVHNMAWGGADGRTLFLCARDRLYRMEIGVGRNLQIPPSAGSSAGASR